MGRKLAAVATLGVAALLGGCGGVDQGDQTACDLVANASSAVAEAVVDSEQASEVDKDVYRTIVRAADGAVASQIEIAIDKANDAELLAALTTLLDYKTQANAGSDDAGMAYFLQLTSVETACGSLGASSEFKSFDDFE